MQLVKQEESEKDENGRTITIVTDYSYNNSDPSLVTRTESKGSDRLLIVRDVTYPTDYAPGGFITPLLTNNIVSVPVETIVRKNGRIISGQLSTYNPNGIPNASYRIELDQPLSQSLFKLSNKASVGDYVRSGPNVSFDFDSRYIQKSLVSSDSYMNLNQISPTGNVPTSYIWGYSNQYPIAEAKNAEAKDIFFTSFEENGGNSSDNDCKTGRMSKTDGFTKTLTGLTNGQYLLSYWYKSGGTWNLNTTSVTVSSGSYSINIIGQVDELRFLPKAALIKTYTYDVLKGISSESDERNSVRYFEYDGFGRLENIRDNERNIIKRYEYNYGNNRCGTNCYLVDLKTFTGYKTPGYPVGVFDLSKQYLGIAYNADGYVNLWNSSAANSAIGILSKTSDPLRFSISAASGATVPVHIYGLRYYQFDSNGPNSVSLQTDALSFIDWGDGSKELINGTRNAVDAFWLYAYSGITDTDDFGFHFVTASHQYSTIQPRIITVFHNETTEDVTFSNADGSMANDATDNINIRGNYPEKVKHIAYYGISNSSDVNVINFSSLTEVMSVGHYFDGSVTTKHNNWQSVNNFHKIRWIKMYFKFGNEIFSNLKNNFPELELLDFHDYKPNVLQDWAVFPKLKLFLNTTIANPYTTAEINFIINNSAGSINSNGILKVFPEVIRSGESDNSYNNLISRNWLIKLY